MIRAGTAVATAAALAFALFAAPGAHALTYEVDTFGDSPSGNCDTPTPADCPLRRAITLANGTMADDEIVLTVDPQLSMNGTDENLNASDDIDVNGTSGGALTIRSDTGVRTISRQAGANSFRILDLSGGGNTLTLQDLDISGGDSVTVPLGGGGIRFTGFNPASTLRLDNVNLHNNVVGSGVNEARGGGLAASGQGSVEVVGGSVVEGNRAADSTPAGSKGFGAGIFVDGGVDLTIADSTVATNSAGVGVGPNEARGGGIYVRNNQPVTSSVDIINTTIDNNQAGGLGTAGSGYFGGGLYVESSSAGSIVNTSLASSSLSGNAVGGGSGGAQGNGGGASVVVNPGAGGGELTLDGVDVTGNRAGGSDGLSNPTMNNTAAGLGAGIASNVDTTITNSAVSGNRAGVVEGAPALSIGGTGAGLFIENQTSLTPDLTITGSSLEDNQAGNAGGGGGSPGGAIFANNEGALSISSSTLDGNQTKGPGGAIFRLVTAVGPADSITDTSITGNTAGASGGGIDVSTSRFFTIARSLLEGNSSAQFGGGISASSESGASPLGRLRLLNSTVTGNSSGLDTPTGTALPAGGGIALGFGEETDFVSHFSTIAQNTVFAGTSTAGGFGRGGNIYFAPDLDAGSPSVTFAGTIVSGGAATGTGATEPNCTVSTGITPASSGGNLEGLDSAGNPTTSCGFTNIGQGDQTGVNPLLAALADNGGPTSTRALQPGSPALNGVPAAVCNATGLTVDQRGETRPFAGGLCDIGAYELGDRDGDGVLDTSDSCPLDVGPATNNGCPVAIIVDPTVNPPVNPPSNPPQAQPPAKKCKKAKKKKGKKAAAAACKKKKKKKK